MTCHNKNLAWQINIMHFRILTTNNITKMSSKIDNKIFVVFKFINFVALVVLYCSELLDYLTTFVRVNLQTFQGFVKM